MSKQLEKIKELIAKREKARLGGGETGIAVIEKDGRVAYSNNAALNLLGIATFGHIRQLRAVSDSLYESFQTIADGNEERASYYNESGKMTISLTAPLC